MAPGRPHPMSRRDFLIRLGQYAGTGMMLNAMASLGMGIASAQEIPPPLGPGNGKSVLILGAGLAGLCAAYELSRAGYNCTVLEARGFAGGRCQTARRGTVMEEVTGAHSVCEFDEGQYFNHGPWRIPYHHLSTLHYTKVLNVPLELMLNDNEQAYIYSERGTGALRGKAVRRQEVAADMRGYEAEILAKSIHQLELDSPLNEEDLERFVDYLVAHGALSTADRRYLGTRGRGYDVPRGGLLNAGSASTPHSMADLLDAGLWQTIRSVASFDQPKTMFQPVGGMDRIASAFEREIGHLVTYNAEISRITQNQQQVTIRFRNPDTNETQETSADFCVCTLPLFVLKNIESDFPDAFRTAMNAASAVTSCKLGLQMNSRFWEEKDRIYGGHSRVITELENVQISYPSHGFQGSKGIVQGIYNFGTDAVRYSVRSLDDRLEHALQMGEKIHPDYRSACETSFGVAWHLVKYSMGAYASWSQEAYNNEYRLLCEPSGRVFLCGDHMSYLPGWMAGAFDSTWQQLARLHEMAQNA
ncbi:MAG: flavin monoamine oxidase family protein [Pseudohongiellaceae bacterium]